MKLTASRALLPATVLTLSALVLTAPAAQAAQPTQASQSLLPGSQASQGSCARAENLQGRLDALAEGGGGGRAQYWYVDPATCTLSLTVLGGDSDRSTDAFLATATADPTLTRVTETSTPVAQRIASVPAPEAPATAAAVNTLRGGTPIYSGTSGTVYECTSGFNGYRPGAVTTAGHCGQAAPTWYTDTAKIGSVSDVRFPGADWAVITPVAGWTLLSEVTTAGGTQEITGFGKSALGEQVCGTGATTGTQCGYVEATSVTVNYPQGVVTGLVESTQRGGEGDSGGPVFDNAKGLGLISGGPQSGGSPTFFQPLNF